MGFQVGAQGFRVSAFGVRVLGPLSFRAYGLGKILESKTTQSTTSLAET